MDGYARPPVHLSCALKSLRDAHDSLLQDVPGIVQRTLDENQQVGPEAGQTTPSFTHLCMSELSDEHGFRVVVCLEQSTANPSHKEQRTKVQADTAVPAFHQSDCIGQMLATGVMKFCLPSIQHSG